MGPNQMKQVNHQENTQGFINRLLATKKKRILNPHSAQLPILSQDIFDKFKDCCITGAQVYQSEREKQFPDILTLPQKHLSMVFQINSIIYWSVDLHMEGLHHKMNCSKDKLLEKRKNLLKVQDITLKPKLLVKDLIRILENVRNENSQNLKQLDEKEYIETVGRKIRQLKEDPSSNKN